MSEWIAIYEEGYSDVRGNEVLVARRREPAHGWNSPEAAIKAWTERGDFREKDHSRTGNGKTQMVDVSSEASFSALGVVSIWRRITFEQVGA